MRLLRILLLRVRLYLLRRRLSTADYPAVLALRDDALRTLREVNRLRMR